MPPTNNRNPYSLSSFEVAPGTTGGSFTDLAAAGVGLTAWSTSKDLDTRDQGGAVDYIDSATSTYETSQMTCTVESNSVTDPLFWAATMNTFRVRVEPVDGARYAATCVAQVSMDAPVRGVRTYTVTFLVDGVATKT